jgi:hypothetical protein
MVHQLGHLGIFIDYGSNIPGSVLQRQVRENGRYTWEGYLVDGQPLTAPIDVKSLPPGEYQLKP